MKKSLLLTTALVLGSIQLSWAGGVVEPKMETEVVKEQTGSSGSMVVPLLLILVIAAAASRTEAPSPFSDIRLKEDVVAIGMTPQGLPLYRYRYFGLPQVWTGVMAQDVARLFPGAIVKKAFGFMAVDYDKLGLRLCQVG